MRVSFVLRLAPDELDRGQLVGEVEHVGTGASAGVRDAAELMAFCRRVGGSTIPAHSATAIGVRPAAAEGDSTDA